MTMTNNNNMINISAWNLGSSAPGPLAFLLPHDFIPGDHTIIIGRGRTVKQHVANMRFDRMVAAIAHDYSAAMCKSEKGMILTRLINEIHDQGPNAGFVKKDPTTGRWYAVDESLARTTAAQAIRNYLHGQYRSSKQFKSQRRMEQIKEQEQQQVGGAVSGSSNASVSARSSSSSRRQCSNNSNNVCHHQHKNTDDASEDTRCVSPCESDCCSQQQQKQQQQQCQVGAYLKRNVSEGSKDTFNILFHAFGNKVTEDPFSPTPLLAQTVNSTLPLFSFPNMESNNNNESANNNSNSSMDFFWDDASNFFGNNEPETMASLLQI